MSKGKLFIISGASGVGKSTVLGRVMAQRDDLRFSVSATTRKPRPGEVDGVSYYFVTKEQFEAFLDVTHPKLVKLYWPISGAVNTLRQEGVSGILKKLRKRFGKGETR